MRLAKYHGLGNDFLVALESDNPGLAVDPALVRQVCDRRTGVGADGVLFGLEPSDPSCDVQMVLVNSDGSRAEISGNGIRCLAQAVLRSWAARGAPEGDTPAAPALAGNVNGPPVVRVGTDSGVREVAFVDGDPQGEAHFTVGMGRATDGPEPSEASRRWGAERLATVDIGNPHLVLEVPDASSVDVASEGPALEADYPLGINVHFVTLQPGDGIELRVWERGAGVTRACGSGAVAAVVAADRWGAVDAASSPIEVHMPGGSATVQLREGEALLTGPSTHVADVVVELPPGDPGGSDPGAEQ